MPMKSDFSPILVLFWHRMAQFVLHVGAIHQIFFLHTHYSYAAPLGEYHTLPGGPSGFKVCQVNQVLLRGLGADVE